MKLYEYKDDNQQTKTISDQQILYEYWDDWEAKMIEKFGENHRAITHENCIDYWTMVHRAWEKQ